MKQDTECQTVLGVCFATRGIAYAFFESPLSPVDWGIREIKGHRKNAAAFDAAKQLIERLKPEVVVLEDLASPHHRRTRRVRRLHRQIISHVVGQGLDAHSFSRSEIRACFKAVGAVTRYEIAQAIASQVHAFGHLLPRFRKLWMSEDSRMNLFDAASLVMTFYCGRPMKDG